MAHADDALPFVAADLAPGDARSLAPDRGRLVAMRVASAAHPWFPRAYDRLWAEFGAAREMETRAVIEQRLSWQPARRFDDTWLRYELVVVRQEAELVAVRDHTAIVRPGPGGPRAVVHLSHVVVEAAWRRTGLAGWLRAWPLQTARAALAAAGFPADTPITLVAEMEHPAADAPPRMIRLQSYEKAGFLKLDPHVVPYHQPDFRPPAEIDAGGGPHPLPFALIVRRVGREMEMQVPGAEVRSLVTALYRMFETGFRPQDMAAVWPILERLPADEGVVQLVPPTT